MQGAAPLLRKNTVHTNRKAGVLFHEGGGGTLLECEIARTTRYFLHLFVNSKWQARVETAPTTYYLQLDRSYY